MDQLKKTIFNDPDKLKRTKEEMTSYFKPEEGGIESKIKGLLGMKDENPRKMLASQIAMKRYGK